jgi:hypothetical protein
MKVICRGVGARVVVVFATRSSAQCRVPSA